MSTSPTQAPVPTRSRQGKLAITQRRPYTRSKLACRTCRNRKIRCDETVPFCANCTKTGRVCDGVSASLPKAKPIKFISPLTSSHFKPEELAVSLLPCDQDEFNFLDMFRSRLVYDIVGRDTMSKQSWKRIILQAVHEEEALRHAVIALSAISSTWSRTPKTINTRGGRLDQSLQEQSSANQFALLHYGKSITALKELVKRSDSRSINVTLLCALICICFEVQRREPEVAQIHFQQSLNIIQSSSDSVEDEITLAFRRLDLQASIYLGARVPALNAPALNPEPAIPPKPAYESSYHEVEHTLTVLNTSLYRFFRTTANKYRYVNIDWIPLEVIDEAQRLEAQLRQFYDVYLKDTPADRTREQDSLLRIKYLTSLISVATCLYAEETIFDQFLPEFTTIVDRSDEILDSRLQQPGDFTIDMGIIHPLYMTASKCRCPKTRRRAIQIMYNFPETEGIWDGWPNARVAETGMEFEEEGLQIDLANDDVKCSLIPEWKRVHSADLYPDAKNRTITAWYRWLPNGLDGGWEDVRRDLSW